MTGRVYDWVDDLVGVASELPIPNKFLWLNLAQPDPIYVLPILVFVTMFVSQKLMSPAKSKKQEDKKKQQEENPVAGMTQSMQYTMPLMFGFFSLSFPAGLSIYFILSNIIGIGQGYYTRLNMAREKEAMASRPQMPKTTGLPPEATAKPAPKKAAPKQPAKRSAKKRSAKRKRR
jgi:YidC/Oxa1 family membrane protein insertase